ncbi:GNAT family N-acetyltransferase [Phenylobacterium sp.]|uniref:GNAT family N-acetyltransferase n=1 Tax=Phenylobacterium sp. TaxID=1871053 RepID=UPI0035219BB5
MMSQLRNNTEAARYEMDEQGETSWADYRLQGERLYIDHVESPPALRGTGAAGRLMKALAQDARDRGLKITPICGYASAWLRRSPEFKDLVS